MGSRGISWLYPELGAPPLGKELTGSDWTTDELTRIISDYFSMLEAELEGRSYSKQDRPSKRRWTRPNRILANRSTR